MAVTMTAFFIVQNKYQKILFLMMPISPPHRPLSIQSRKANKESEREKQ